MTPEAHQQSPRLITESSFMELIGVEVSKINAAINTDSGHLVANTLATLAVLQPSTKESS